MDSGNESPPLRSTILGTFLRGRPRNSSQSHIINTDIRELSPSPPQPPSPGGFGHRRSRIAATTAVQPSASHQVTSTTAGLGLSHMLRRRRSAGTIATPGAAPPPAPPQPLITTIAAASAVAVSAPPHSQSNTASSTPGVHRIRLVPHIDSRRSLRFDAIGRDLREGDSAIRIGRFTDRSGMGLAAVNALSSNKLAFKSKVVSRAHAEIWVESGPKFFIKDTKSSSGTFLNHMRLSAANTESRPYQMKDGDILQLGVDYQGGTEDIYKSVKIKVEIGREWQATANAFNTNALKNLKTLGVAPSKSVGALTAAGKPGGGAPTGKLQIPDCCICLFSVTIRQALFIAPCSHTFHYKCIRPMLESHHPAFSCPLCRTFADLEEDVEVDIEDLDAAEDDESAVGDAASPAPPLLSERDRGAETEVETDALRPAVRMASAQVRRLSGGLEEGDEAEMDGDEVMLDLGGARMGDSDGEFNPDENGAQGPGGTDGEGSGGGGVNGDSPGLMEICEVDDAIEVDDTIGGKRKR